MAIFPGMALLYWEVRSEYSFEEVVLDEGPESALFVNIMGLKDE